MKQHSANANRAPASPIAYSIQGASEASGLSVRKLMSDIATGELRSFKRGRRRLVFREDLERYLRGQLPPSTDEGDSSDGT